MTGLKYEPVMIWRASRRGMRRVVDLLIFSIAISNLFAVSVCVSVCMNECVYCEMRANLFSVSMFVGLCVYACTVK